MPNPPTESEKLFEAYLHAHGYMFEHDLDWRARFDVDTEKNPDYLVGREGEDLAICEIKERTSTEVDRRLTVHRVASFSSETVLTPVARSVTKAAQQLAPLEGVGLPLIAVLANSQRLFVPLGSNEMAMSLFGKNDVVRVPIIGPGIPQRVSMGDGALARDDAAGNRYNPHPYLSAVVVVHARTHEQDFADREVAARRPTEPLRSPAARHAHAVSTLEALNAAEQEGRIPDGEYEWVEVFDLSGLGAAFSGTPLPTNIFDGPRDRRYVLDDHGFVERRASAGHL
jgi:hypothetical protein